MTKPNPQVQFKLVPILPGSIAFTQPSKVLHHETRPGVQSKVLVTRFTFHPCNDINSYEISKLMELFFSGFQTAVGDLVSGSKTSLDFESFIHTHDLSRHFKVESGEVEIPPVILIEPVV